MHHQQPFWMWPYLYRALREDGQLTREGSVAPQFAQLLHCLLEQNVAIQPKLCACAAEWRIDGSTPSLERIAAFRAAADDIEIRQLFHLLAVDIFFRSANAICLLGAFLVKDRDGAGHQIMTMRHDIPDNVSMTPHEILSYSIRQLLHRMTAHEVDESLHMRFSDTFRRIYEPHPVGDGIVDIHCLPTK